MSCLDVYLAADCSLLVDNLTKKYKLSKDIIKNIVEIYLQKNQRVRLLVEDCRVIEKKALEKIKSSSP